MQQNKTVSIVEGALCIALSFILSQFFLFRFSQDGAISFELTPLIILTYRRGFKIGVISGAVFGLIRCILGGYFMNIIQVLLDYPLAFACVGFAAIRPKILGLIIAALGTISCSVISGVIFFLNLHLKARTLLYIRLLLMCLYSEACIFYQEQRP